MRTGTITQAHVYRFNDTVALNLEVAGGQVQTLYLTRDLAELVQGLVLDTVEDIDSTNFSKSELPSWTAELVCNEARLRKGF